MKLKSSLLAVAVMACALVLLSAPTVLAMPASPQLLQRAEKDPALAAQVKASEALAEKNGVNSRADVTVLRLGPIGVSQFLTETPAPSSGQLKTLALVIDFSDNVHQVSSSFFDNLLFADVFGPSSLRGYYREVSYGTPTTRGILDVVTLNAPSSTGWLRMPQTYAYYTDGQNGFGVYPRNAQKMVEDAVLAANAVVDFSQYDADHDGFVDNLFIVHAGQGAELTGSLDDIWSHQWGTHGAVLVDGVYVSTYSTEPEYWVTPGDMTVGVYAHEMGHVMGLPDLYDRDYTSEGVGEWSLMSSGSWNGSNWPGGDLPSRLDAWCSQRLGWLQPTTITGAPSVQNVPTVGSTVTGSAYKFYPSGGTSGSEYFLVENRQQAGTDLGLPGAGMLIWHVDESVGTQNDNESHKLVDVEEAGGVQQMDGGLNRGNADDPYPGTANNRTFDDGTTPNAKRYSGEDSTLIVDQISNSSSTMTARMGFALPDTTPLTVNGPTVVGNISPAGDADWYEFTAANSGDYVITTTAGTLTDTYMYLYGPDDRATLITEDDDSGEGNAAMITRSLTPGTYYLKVRAYLSGSTGTYSINVTSSSLPTPERFEQTDPRLSYFGAWSTGTSTSYSGGSLALTATTGASMTVAFTGTSVDYIGTRSPSMGWARIALDGGEPELVNLYSVGTSYRTKIWGAAGLSETTHTLVIECAGIIGGGRRGGRTINLDALDILGDVVTPVPAVTAVSPTSGPEAGATSVVITGSGLSGATAVTFGTTPATSYTVNSATQITAVAPAGSGTVHVTVTTPGGTSTPGSADQYTYVMPGPPVVTGISPNSGPVSGGSGPVVINGSDFVGATAVRFGVWSVVAGGFAVNAAGTQITVTAIPAGTGSVHVTVTTPVAESVPSGADLYTYVELPATPTRFEQTDSHLVWAGTWTTSSSSVYSGGSYKYTYRSGAKATVYFTGTRLDLIAKKGSNCGKAYVSVDGGEKQLVDLYNPSSLYKQSVWSSPVLTDQTHWVVIEWTGQKNLASSGTYVNIDALDVVGVLVNAPVPPTPTRFEQTDSHLVWEGTWSLASSSSYSGGSYKYTSSNGAKVTIAFTGTSFTLIAKKAGNCGKAYVSLDGGTPVLVDLYSARTAYKQKVWSNANLSAGPHTIVIEWSGEKNSASTGTYINVDAVDVVGVLN